MLVESLSLEGDGVTTEMQREMEEAVKVLLRGMGEDISREGLVDTPRRVVNMFLEMTEGLRVSPPPMTTFSKGSTDQMVIVSDIAYTSLCEHHLAPFTGRVHIGYLPRGRLAGLSKLGRIVEWYAKRPQIQERFTSQIADRCVDELDPVGIIVVAEGHHQCMSMRGIKKENHKTVTTAIRGLIAKNEFFQALGVTRGHNSL
jgi:GTP cyclohydrolase IA